MLRYLSPAKICLVILIELYRTNEVKSTDSITLLSFISTHTLRRSSDILISDGPAQPDSIRTLAEFQSLLSPLTSSFPGRSLYDVFLRKLWNLQSLESLEQLFNTVRLVHNVDLHLLTLRRVRHQIWISLWPGSLSVPTVL